MTDRVMEFWTVDMRDRGIWKELGALEGRGCQFFTLELANTAADALFLAGVETRVNHWKLCVPEPEQPKTISFSMHPKVAEHFQFLADMLRVVVAEVDKGPPSVLRRVVSNKLEEALTWALRAQNECSPAEGGGDFLSFTRGQNAQVDMTANTPVADDLHKVE